MMLSSFLYLLPLYSLVTSKTLSNSISDYSFFDLTCSANIEGGNITVKTYQSPRTNLTIVVANVEGPLVNGYLVLATEAQSDDGLPHTLEHLIFLGSEDYPYKGVLDLTASRCLASGTNAWTAVDHTAYTIETAGSEGMLNFLPIYLDHLLYPTLKESAYITEVYHITGKGKDAGVVYSEMQSRENGKGDRLWGEFSREMYPAPSGYRYRTGGVMSNLRNSTNLEKIRAYHAAFYRPENLQVVIFGQIEPEEVFEAVSTIEEKIMSKGPRPPFHKPWQSEVPPITRSVDKEVLYNSDKEKQGAVVIGWRGPCPVNQLEEYYAVGILMTFLTHSSISPLRRVFVEIDDSLALSVSGWVDHYSVSNLGFIFSGVDLKNMTKIKPTLYRTLKDLSTMAMLFDMSVMDTFLDNLAVRGASSLEGDPQGTIASIVINQALYGTSCDNLKKRLNKSSVYSSIRKRNKNYWLNLIRKYMLNQPSITIRATPSIARSEEKQEEKKEREEKRKEELGEAGLEALKEKLDNAKKQNEILPPAEMISSVPVPGTQSITYHYLNPFSNIDPQSVPDGISTTSPPFFNFTDMPLKLMINDIHSNFVEIETHLDTSKLRVELRQYLPLLIDLLFESSIKRGDEVIGYEEVIKQRDADLLSSGASLSLGGYGYFSCGSFCHVVRIRLEVDMKRYEKGVQWMQDVLFNVMLDKERIKVKANNILNSISSYKTSASTILSVIYNDIMLKNDTNINRINAFRMEPFLKDVIKKLDKNPDEVIDILQEIKTEITRLDNLVVAIGTNFYKLSMRGDPALPWRTFAPDNQVTTDYKLEVIPYSSERSYEDLGNITGYIYGLKSIESGYLRQVASSLSDPRHPDIYALRVAIKYLTQTEGPLWREIRGKGLAYSYSLFLSTHHGNLFLNLARASQLTDAYSEALNIIRSFLNGTRKFEQSLLESAKSSLIYGAIASESQVYSKFRQSIFSFYNKIPLNREYVENISKVTLPEIESAAKKYLASLIDPSFSTTIIVCHPSNINDTISTLTQKYGHNLLELEDIENSRFAT